MTERENILIDALISAGHIAEQARTAMEKLKAENAELCDREEIRKETAREILQELYNRLELVSEDGACTMMLCNTHLFDLAKQFNVNLEDEE